MAGRSVTVLAGLVLAIGMGVLLLIWLDRGEGAGITGFLFIALMVVGFS